MNAPIISVRGIGKKYRLGFTHSHDTLRDKIAGAAGHIFQSLPRGKRINDSNQKANHRISLTEQNQFWALKDISFDVREGEVVGIIGANGAGKSTLLKILSEITEPTKGEMFIKGRIASLLEVGTGFHPELSGRENVFMNGAILGMTKAEIDAKFDEIVAFSEVYRYTGKAILKRYECQVGFCSGSPFGT